MSDVAGLLRRLAKAPPPLTPARALRLAVTRAAEGALGLPLAALGVSEEEGELDDLLGRLEEGLMLLALRQGGRAAGLVALDAEGRAAAIEAQALGRIAPAAPDPREPTAADAALAHPFLAAVLREAEGALAGTPLEGWLDGSEAAERVAPREAPLLLRDGRYRALRLTLDLGAGGRHGLLLVLARLAQPPGAVALPTLAPLVLSAPTPVDAVLHRLRVPLSVAEGWAEGDLLPLPGVTVASLSLESRGLPLAPARLGQSAGMRAVRIEAAVTPDIAPLPGAAPVLLPDVPPCDLPPPEDPATWEPPTDLPALDWSPPEEG